MGSCINTLVSNTNSLVGPVLAERVLRAAAVLRGLVAAGTTAAARGFLTELGVGAAALMEAALGMEAGVISAAAVLPCLAGPLGARCAEDAWLDEIRLAR